MHDRQHHQPKPSPRVLRSLTTALAVATALVAMGPALATPQPPPTREAVPLDRYLAQVEATGFTELDEGTHVKVRDAAAFAEMKKHLLDLYQGVESPLSFVTAHSGQTVDCIPIQMQEACQAATAAEIPRRPADRSAERERSLDGPEHRQRMVGPQFLPGTPSCPTDTIPMLRVELDTMTRFETLRDFLGKKRGHLSERETAESDSSTHLYAIGRQNVSNTGVTGFLNLWSPYVPATADFSLSQLWLTGGSGSNLQTVESGWQVYPKYYGTNYAVPFILYTPDDYASGCYNLTCSAFCQTSTILTFGVPWPASEYSAYGGDQGGFNYTWQRDSSGNWWLDYDLHTVGYYPVSVWDGGQMSVNAEVFDAGGEVAGSSTSEIEMGSGYYAYAGFGWAAYQFDLEYFSSGSWNSANMSPIETVPSCYTIDISASTHYFGGPGC